MVQVDSPKREPVDKWIFLFVLLLLIAIILGLLVPLLFAGHGTEDFLGRVRAFVHLAAAILFVLTAFIGVAFYLKRLLGSQIVDPQLHADFRIDKLGLVWKEAPTGL